MFDVFDEKVIYHQRIVAHIRRTPYVTIALVLINIALYIFLKVVARAMAGSENDSDMAYQFLLIVSGAKENYLINRGQWYRFVSPLFYHANFIHLFFNQLALYYLGKIVENLYGRVQFLFIYFVSGIASIFTSYVATVNPSVGASGAIFGIFGAIFVFGIKHRDKLNKVLKKFFINNTLLWIGINVAIGFSIPQIDNSAHLGGLVCGIIVTYFLKDDIFFVEKGSFFDKAVNISGVFLAVFSIGTGIYSVSKSIGNIKLPDIAWVKKAVKNTTIVVPQGWYDLKKFSNLRGESVVKEEVFKNLKGMAFMDSFHAVFVVDMSFFNPGSEKVTNALQPQCISTAQLTQCSVVDSNHVVYFLIFPNFLKKHYAHEFERLKKIILQKKVKI